MAISQNWEAVKSFEALVNVNISNLFSKPLQKVLTTDAKGQPVLYLNFTTDTGQNDDDVAIFLRAASPVTQEMFDNWVARSNTDGHKVGPASLIEVWVQDCTSLVDDRARLAQEVIYFLRGKQWRNALLFVVDGAHPELEGIFGATADSAATASSRSVGPSMLGSN
jgi:hypothetical protein